MRSWSRATKPSGKWPRFEERGPRRRGSQGAATATVQPLGLLVPARGQGPGRAGAWRRRYRVCGRVHNPKGQGGGKSSPARQDSLKPGGRGCAAESRQPRGDASPSALRIGLVFLAPQALPVQPAASGHHRALWSGGSEARGKLFGRRVGRLRQGPVKRPSQFTLWVT